MVYAGRDGSSQRAIRPVSLTFHLRTSIFEVRVSYASTHCNSSRIGAKSSLETSLPDLARSQRTWSVPMAYRAKLEKAGLSPPSNRSTHQEVLRLRMKGFDGPGYERPKISCAVFPITYSQSWKPGRASGSSPGIQSGQDKCASFTIQASPSDKTLSNRFYGMESSTRGVFVKLRQIERQSNDKGKPEQSDVSHIPRHGVGGIL